MKKLIALMVLAAFAVSVVGCGETAPSSPTKGGSTAAGTKK
jgi:hypothetical protein